MKLCPMCAQEYYDEVRRCPDCAYAFPASESGDQDERIRQLIEASEGDPDKLWRLSPQHLKNAAEYEIARARLRAREEA